MQTLKFSALSRVTWSSECKSVCIIRLYGLWRRV